MCSTAPRAPGVLSAGGFILDDLESARAKALLGTELGVPPSALVVVFSSLSLQAGTPAFESAAAGAMRDVPNAPHVVRLLSHVLAPQQDPSELGEAIRTGRVPIVPGSLVELVMQSGISSDDEEPY